MSLRHALLLLTMALILSGCGSESPRTLYLLGDPGEPPALSRNETGLPVIELARVALPDYLDSTDLLRRGSGQELVVSRNGRWAERLSLAITDALIATLSRQLPQDVITARSESRPSRRLSVEIEHFDLTADGHCLISARWRLNSGDGRTNLATASASLEATAASPDDPAMVAAMTGLLNQLATRIAATVRQP